MMQFFPVIEYLPQVIEVILVLIVGYIAAYLVKRGINRALNRIGFDDLCSRANITQAFNRMGLKSVSSLIANYLFWLIFILSVYLSFGFVTVPEASLILNRISIILLDVVAAIGIIFSGIAIMEIFVTVLRRIFSFWNLEQVFAPVDRAIERTGLKTFDVLYITVRIFVMLLFIELALLVFRASFLFPYVTPALVFVQRLIVAIFVIIIGVAITEFLIRVIFGILSAVGVMDVVEPLERTMKVKGIITIIIKWILRISFFLVFLQIAFAVVNLPTGPIISVLAYFPKALLAIVILIVAWWLSSRLGMAFEKFALDRDLPFVDLFTMSIRFTVIYVGVIIALDELGLAIEALYILLAFIVGGFCVALAGVFILGFKDVGADFASSMQLKRNGDVGDTILFENHMGRIVEITNLSTTIETDEGNMIVPNTRLKDAIIIKNKP